MTNHPDYDYDGVEHDIRIFVEWTEHGTWFNSLSEDFHDLLVKHTKEFGPPDKVEFRDKKDWLHD